MTKDNKKVGCLCSLLTKGVEFVGTCYLNNLGSAPLNFKVVGYSSEEALNASNPSNNTIGIVTDIDITGWHFSPVEPENPFTGLVWIKIGNPGGGTFNALKKNGITICPCEAYQYINKKWGDRVAKTYQNGSWKSWVPDVFYLYKDGNQYTDVTGGWYGAVAGSNYLEVSDTYEQDGGRVCETFHLKPVDVSTFSTLEVDIVELAGELTVSIYNTKDVLIVEGSVTQTGTFRGDISSLSGSIHVSIWAFNTGSLPAFAVSEVRLLR